MREVDFGSMVEPVVRILYGEPNREFTKAGIELRWGNHGSLAVDLKKQVWFDHEQDEGGGVLDLLARDMGFSKGEGLSWLKEKGFDVPDNDRSDEAPKKRTVVATYDYVNEFGDLVFQVVRWDPKNFTQRRPSPDEPDVWINGLRPDHYMRRGPGEDWWRYNEERYEKFRQTEKEEFPACDKMPVYRLPDILEAIAMGQQVFLVEGEKDADNLWREGVPATTVAGGSKKWQSHYAEFFRGAHVVLCPDNDVTGRQHVANIGRKLKGVAKTTVVLDLKDFWPEAPEKADLSDWKAAGFPLDMLYEVVAEVAQEWKPEPPPSKFGAIPFNQLDAPGEEHEYLIANMLTRKEIAMIYGASKSGKSFMALDMSFAIARGQPFNGRRTLSGGVVYQAGEGGVGLKKRMRAYRDSYMPTDEVDIPFVLMTKRVDFFGEGSCVDDFIAEINAWKVTFRRPLELVVIDTFATATPGANENASTDMSHVLKNCERVRVECDSAVMLVHHMNSGGEKPRGHTSIFANIENALECMITDRVDTVERPDNTFFNRDIRRLRVTKNKDGEDGIGFDFILRQVILGQNSYNENITSCVCDMPSASGSSGRKEPHQLTDQQYNVMQSLITAINTKGIIPPAELQLPESIRAVVYFPDWRQAYIDLTEEGDDDPKQTDRVRNALKRAGDTFLRRKYIGRASKYVWLTGKPTPGFENVSILEPGGGGAVAVEQPTINF